MKQRGVSGAMPVVAGLVMGCILIAGCGTDVKEGTQVQISEETKAQIQDMRDVYKDMGKDKRKD